MGPSAVDRVGTAARAEIWEAMKMLYALIGAAIVAGCIIVYALAKTAKRSDERGERVSGWWYVKEARLADCHSIQTEHIPTGIQRETMMPPPGLWRNRYWHPQDPTNHTTFRDALRSAAELGFVPAEKVAPYLEE